MKKQYIAELKDEILTEDARIYFKEKDITVVKILSKLDLLIILCEEALTKKQLKYINILEEDTLMTKSDS